MKQLLLTIITACAATSFAQIDYFIEGQQVDNTIQQEVLLGNSSGPVLTDFAFVNLSGTYVEWTIDVCVLVDDPNLEFTDFVWTVSTDPFGGIHVPSFITQSNPCQSLTTNAAMLQDTDTAIFQMNIDVTGTGCEVHRYYLVDNGVVQDSMDVQYCSVLSVDELTNASVEIFPNPTSDLVHINSEQSIASFEVVDLQGKVLQSQQVSGLKEMSVQLKQFPEGLYLLQVQLADDTKLSRSIRVVHE